MLRGKITGNRVLVTLVALLVFLTFSFIMLCNNIVTLTLCTPYTVLDPASGIFKASDGVCEWRTETAVDIFSVSYSNDKGELTVKSHTKDKLLAPGTEQAYDFRVRNSYTDNIKYTLTAEASFSDSGKIIPVRVRFSDYEGNYFIGSGSEWADPMELNLLSDTRTVAPDHYIRYTLDWSWVFENGTDDYDTFLGNAALDEDIVFTVKLFIYAEAEESPYIPETPSPAVPTPTPIPTAVPETPPPVIPTEEPVEPDINIDPPVDPGNPGNPGIPDSPKTGDDSRIALWAVLFTISALGLVYLILVPLRKKDEKQSETDR